ncbi:MAG: type IX secretion system membrane protein PorP/SprF [Prevotellaceae bacterium]|jgi:type IX secretion system PorP/SprF family membrane protein|nr:type IX secretion system membrane protein PorP/SprF [Prevotellaceae bacterium]
MKKFFYLLLHLLPALAMAHPDVSLNQSSTSCYLLNPAYAAMQELTYASLQVRAQWSGMPGAPQQQYLSLEHSLQPQKAGLGVMLFNEQSNVIANTGGYLSYRHSFRLSRRQRLSPAVSLGLLQNKIDFDRIVADNPFELSIVSGQERQTRLNANLGLLYAFSNFLEVGIAAYRLFNSAYDYRDYTSGYQNAYALIRSFGFSIRYIKTFSEIVEAWALLYLYSDQGLPVSPSLRLNCAYLPYGVSVSGGYTWEGAFSCSAAIWLYDKLSLGYTAEIPPATIKSYVGLTQQVSVGVRIGQPAQVKPGRVSPGDIEALRRLNQESFEQVERIEQAQEEDRQRARRQQSKIDSLEREVAYLRQMSAAAQAELKSMHEAYLAADTLPPDATLYSTPDSTPTSAYYVVVGYYLLRGYAERYQHLLQSEIQLPTEILALNNGYYVYTKVAHSPKEVQQEYRRLRELGVGRYAYGNVWALQQPTGKP